MQSGRVKASVLIAASGTTILMVAGWLRRVRLSSRRSLIQIVVVIVGGGGASVQMRFYVQRFGVERALTIAAYLLVDVRRRFGHVQCRPDADRRSVQMSGPDFWYMTRTIHLLVFLAVLVVEVRLQRQLGPANAAFEAAAVEECEIFQRPHPVYLVHDLVAA